MCPGRFPSPTPSRESTPVEFIDNRPNPFTVSSESPTTPNYTAPESLRKRPRFSDSQSEPSISRHSDWQTSTPTFTSPTPNPRTTDRRRISDVPRIYQKHGRRRDDSAIQKHRIQQRTVSTPSKLPSLSPDSSGPNSPSEDPNTPCQPTVLSPRKTDIKLHKKLLEPPSRSDKKGVVYVIKDPARDELGIKIGFTTCFDYDERMKQHANNCDFVPKELHVTQRLEYCRKTEILVHTDLNNFSRHWACTTKKCDGTKHKEWFVVDEKVAVDTVKKWEAFMNGQRPYGSVARKLKPIWSYLLQQRELAHPITDEVDHDTRRKYWIDMLAAPTYSDHVACITHLVLRTWRAVFTTWISIWTYITEFCWQAVTVIYGFVTLVAFRNTFASCAFALVLVCACFSVLPQSRKLKLSGRIRGKSAWFL